MFSFQDIDYDNNLCHIRILHQYWSLDVNCIACRLLKTNSIQLLLVSLEA